MPRPLDNFTDMAERGLGIIDDIVLGAMGGSIEEGYWIIPLMSSEVTRSTVPETIVPWLTIEDNDPRWIFDGFESQHGNWNASGAYLSRGYANCSAEITFSGTALQYYAYRSPEGGIVSIILDGVSFGEFDQEDHSSIHGQHYVKIFEKLDLSPGDHTLKIVGDSKETEKTIDMLSVIK
jgi:hypothetical protein